MRRNIRDLNIYILRQYDNFITICFFLMGWCPLPGASALVIPPDAVFPCDLGDVDGLQRRDAALDELHQNILRFVYTFAPGADTYITEE